MFHRKVDVFFMVARPLVALAWLLSCAQGAAATEPICKYGGKEFSGGASDFVNLYYTCPQEATSVGGAFSAAFTVRFDVVQDDVRIFDFAARESTQHLIVGVSYGTLFWRILESSNRQTTSTTIWAAQPIKVGEVHRYLVTVDEQGKMQLFLEGQLVNSDDRSPPVATVSRPFLYVAKSHWDTRSPPFDGMIKDLWIWNSVASWEQAGGTTTSEPAPQQPADPNAPSTTRTTTTATLTTTKTKTTTAWSAAAGTAITAVEDAVDGEVPTVAKRLIDANRTEITVETQLGPMTVVNTAALPPSNLGAPLLPLQTAKGSKVSVSRSFLSLYDEPPVVSALVIQAKGKTGQNSSDPFAGLDKNKKVETPSFDLSLFDKNGKPIKGKLKEPLLFKLPDGPNPPVNPDDLQCVFLDKHPDGTPFWSTYGVRRATIHELKAKQIEPIGAEIWCRTDHLSIFAAILDALLGCTNLEMLTPAGMSAVIDNEGWEQSRPALVFFVFCACLFFLFVVGTLRELYALRHGRTFQASKSMKICQSLMQWGPQLIKHKYAALIVFGKDLLHCLAKGRSKLRVPTLTTAVQRCLAHRTGISVPCVSQHCWNGGTWLDSKASIPYTVLCQKVEFHAHVAEEVISRKEMAGHGPVQIIHRFFINFMACHPLLDSLRLGAGSMSVRKRATLQVAGFFGVLATNAMIFNFSGTTLSWEAGAECPISPASFWFMFVATSVSILCNVLPIGFLTNFAKQIHGRSVPLLLWWLVTLGYMSFGAFLVILQLSNLNEKDRIKWHGSFEWAMTLKLLGMPCAQALRHTLMTEYFLREEWKHNNSFLVAVGLRDPNERELTDVQQEAADKSCRKVISAEELVEFYCLLGDKVLPNVSPAKASAVDVFSELHKLLNKKLPDVKDNNPLLRINMKKLVNSSQYTSGVSWEPCATKDVPADRMVAHSRQCAFIDLVSMLLTDAIGGKSVEEAVRAKLQQKDQQGLQDLLKERGAEKIRFWLPLLAMEPQATEEDLVFSKPSVVRKMKRACCERMKADIMAKAPPVCAMPVQLLLMDRDMEVLKDCPCLCEVMQAKSVSITQRMVIHSELLKGSQLGTTLKLFQKNPAKDKSLPWTEPYLSNGEGVFEHFWNMTVHALKQEKEGEVDEKFWSEFGMSDTAAAVGGFLASRRTAVDSDGAGAEDVGAVEDAAAEGLVE